MTLEEFKASFLYVAINKYCKMCYHNYIFNAGDDGSKKTFLFDLTKAVPELNVMVDFYDIRMYPWGTRPDKVAVVFELFKWDTVTGAYVSLGKKTGSDWIGTVTKVQKSVSAGHYKVEVVVSWVPAAVPDFTVAIQLLEPLVISECVKPGTGTQETSSLIADKCLAIRAGSTYAAFDPLYNNVLVAQGAEGGLFPG